MSEESVGSRPASKRARRNEGNDRRLSQEAEKEASASDTRGISSTPDDKRWLGGGDGPEPPHYGIYTVAGGYAPSYGPPPRYPGWQGPYAPPPPMAGAYPMYPSMPPYQGGPAYGPTYQPPPPHLAYYPHDRPIPQVTRYREAALEAGARAEEAAGVPPPMAQESVGQVTGVSTGDLKPPARRRGTVGPTVGQAVRKSSQDDKRSRKNAQSRARAAKLRERIAEMKTKPEEELTEEEQQLLNSFEDRRLRKNVRSRERAIEKKNRMEEISSKPERKRTSEERKYLETALKAKERKNQGDRVRRRRIKEQGARGKSVRGGTSVASRHHFGLPEIPMSPLPTSHLPSPGAFTSPGLVRFPSPPGARAVALGTSGVMETPGGTPSTGTEPTIPLPFIHPQSFETVVTGTTPPGRTQLHISQGSSRIEQRRHPDGSMTISIGGRSNAEATAAVSGTVSARSASNAPYGGEALRGLTPLEEPPMGETNSGAGYTDVSQLLLYSDNGDAETDGARTASAEREEQVEEEKDEEDRKPLAHPI